MQIFNVKLAYIVFVEVDGVVASTQDQAIERAESLTTAFPKTHINQLGGMYRRRNFDIVKEVPNG